MALFAFGFERLFEFGNAMLISLDALLDWRVDFGKHLLQPREFEFGKLLRREQFVALGDQTLHALALEPLQKFRHERRSRFARQFPRALFRDQCAIEPLLVGRRYRRAFGRKARERHERGCFA